MLGEYRRAVVIVARVERLDTGVALQRQWTDYIRGRFVSPPGRTVIGRLPGMHLITKGGGIARLATGRCSWCLVIPRAEESASFADREVGHPLRLGGVGVGVQLEGRAEGHAAVGGTDVKDVAWIAVTGVAGGINVANDVVKGGRLTPALVSPVGGTAVHAGEKAGCGAAGAREYGAGVGIGPGVTAISRAIHFVGPVAETATHLVHAGDVHVARDFVAGDLDVADEGRGDAYRSVPRGAVVTRGGDKKSAAADVEVVPGNVHPVRRRERMGCCPPSQNSGRPGSCCEHRNGSS